MIDWPDLIRDTTRCTEQETGVVPIQVGTVFFITYA